MQSIKLIGFSQSGLGSPRQVVEDRTNVVVHRILPSSQLLKVGWRKSCRILCVVPLEPVKKDELFRRAWRMKKDDLFRRAWRMKKDDLGLFSSWLRNWDWCDLPRAALFWRLCRFCVGRSKRRL